MIAIVVADNGIGVEADQYHFIFTKYYRINNNVEGTGVGLYLVKEIVRSAGGDITVESAPDQGSVFTIKIKP